MIRVLSFGAGYAMSMLGAPLWVVAVVVLALLLVHVVALLLRMDIPALRDGWRPADGTVIDADPVPPGFRSVR